MRMVTALRRHHARARLQQRIEPRLIVLGSSIPKRVDRHVDDARVARCEALVVETEFPHPPRPEILDHDIGLVRKPVDDFASFGAREIDRDAALALVPSEKTETKMAKRVALEAFDLEELWRRVARGSSGRYEPAM